MPKIYSKTFCMIPNSPFCILHVHREKNVVMKGKISEIKQQHFGTICLNLRILKSRIHENSN